MSGNRNLPTSDLLTLDVDRAGMQGYGFAVVSSGELNGERVFFGKYGQGKFVLAQAAAQPQLVPDTSTALRRPHIRDLLLAKVEKQPKGLRAVLWGFKDELDKLVRDSTTWRAVREVWDAAEQVWRTDFTIIEHASLTVIRSFPLPPYETEKGERVGWRKTLGIVSDKSVWTPCDDPRSQSLPTDEESEESARDFSDEVEEVGGERF